MNFLGLKKIFKKNEEEKRLMEKKNLEIENNHSPQFYYDRYTINNKENEMIENYIQCYDETVNQNKEHNKYSFYQLCKLNNRMLNSKQGKVKNIISSFFGQFDKKIYKKLFDNESQISDRRRYFHDKMIIKRYDNLPEYIVKRIVIVLGLISVSLFHILPLIPVIISSSLISIDTIYKSIDALYNKKKFKCPFLFKEISIYKGNYIENIQNAFYEYQKSSELEECMKNMKEKNLLLTTDDFKEKNDQSYGDLGKKTDVRLGMCLPIESDQLNYIQSISKIRKSDDNDERVAAYAKLASTFGNSTRKKKSASDTKVNKYIRTLKLLSTYGKRIKEEDATKEEKDFYLALLYYLGKDFDEDDLTDYLSDLYDKEVEDKEKAKVMCK